MFVVWMDYKFKKRLDYLLDSYTLILEDTVIVKIQINFWVVTEFCIQFHKYNIKTAGNVSIQRSDW
jgi:hypothetical protein